LKSGNASDNFKKADALYNNGGYTDALELLDALDVEYPDTKNIIYARARCHAQLGDTATAITLCEICVEKWGAPRAKELLDELRNDGGDTSDTNLPEIKDLDMDAGLSAAFSAPRVKLGKRRKPNPALLTIAIVGILAIAWSLHYAWLSHSFGSDIGTTDKELVVAKEKRETAKQKRMEIEDGPSLEPGKASGRVLLY